MKLCMIGCGNFAHRFHGPTQQQCAAENPEIHLSACCDVDERRAKAYAGAFGFARHYTEVSRLLDAEKPDAVILAVPPAATCAAASDVLARGVSLLLEKPPGVTVYELERLIDAATLGGAKAQVGFNRRSMPVMRRAKEIFDAALSAGPAVRIDYAMLRRDRWDPDFSTTAVHAVDALRFLAGPFQSALVAYTPQVRGRAEAVDISVEFECRSGIQATLRISPVTTMNEESINIGASNQRLVIKLPFPEESSDDGVVEHWVGDRRGALFSDAGRSEIEKMGILDETRDFLRAVLANAPLSPSLHECFEQVELMEAFRTRRKGMIHFAARDQAWP